jgi:2-haloacid dehalogenase
MIKPPPLTLVFDVGLVLVGADYEPFLAFMRDHGAEAEDMDALCRAVDLDAHERGAIGAAAFMDRLAELAEREPAPAALLAAWNGMYHPVEPMLDLVRAASADHRVHLLSNMGEIHWAHLERAFGIPSLGHGAIASYAVGFLKPDPGIYAVAEERFALDPARTVFIDDRAVNVRAARERGWQAIEHRSPAATRASLAALGVGCAR